MSNATPEHDAYCESGDPEYMTTACRCAERRERRAEIEKREAEGSSGIDPRLLKMRVKRVRQAEAALAAVKRTLTTYITEHAPSHCEWETEVTVCDRERDGVLIFSCGHSAVMCAPHGSSMLRFVQTSRETTCVQTAPPLHEHPAVGVTLEWCGL